LRARHAEPQPFVTHLALAHRCVACSIGRMRLIRPSLALPALLLGLSGCTYYPPVQGDHTSDKYKADLAKCRTSSNETVRLKNAATIGRWVISPITGPPEVRAAIRKCMVADGYTLEAGG
jgi:hypothetical protein